MTKPNPHEQSMLCVGGPLDGERRVADRRHQCVVLTTTDPLPGERAKYMESNQVIYSITAIHSEEPPRYERQSIYLLRHAPMTTTEVIKVLIEGYKK